MDTKLYDDDDDDDNDDADDDDILATSGCRIPTERSCGNSALVHVEAACVRGTVKSMLSSMSNLLC